jgi:hypothetical protein
MDNKNRCRHEWDSFGDYAICRKCCALEETYKIIRNPPKKLKKVREEEE